MRGGSGDDTYIVDNSKDIIREASNKGTDLVNSSVSYWIRDNDVENLTRKLEILISSKVSLLIGVKSLGSKLPLSLNSISIELPAILLQSPQPIQRPFFTISSKELIFVITLYKMGLLHHIF